MMSTKTFIVLPEWLQELYQRFGQPQIYPKPEEGVRFFNGTNWVTRRMWMWNPKIDRIWIHHRVYIDKYADHYETVAESDDTNKPRVLLRTTPPPTEDQILQVLALAQFLEVS